MDSMFSALVLELLFGFDVKGIDDMYIKTNDDALESVMECFIPGRYWVDFIPILEYIPSWMPGASFKRKCAVWMKQADAVKNVPFEAARTAFVCALVSTPCAPF